MFRARQGGKWAHIAVRKQNGVVKKGGVLAMDGEGRKW
jgi:hypothetical protein